MASADALVEEESFLTQVERAREKIGVKFRRAHQVLMDRESTLLSDLQQLESRYRGEGVAVQIREITASKEQLMTTMKGNENQRKLRHKFASLDTRIRELEFSLERVRDKLGSVVFEWNGELERMLSEAGVIRVRAALDYKKKGKPIKTACKHMNEPSKVDGTFCCPQSIAIHPQTKNIYISDEGNNRVQIFSHSLEFILKFNGRMNTPGGLCISQNKVLVTQHKSHCLNVYSIGGQFLRSVGKLGERELEFDMPTGISVSTAKNRIYICEMNTRRIQCLNSNLTFHSFINDILIPKDVKCTPDEIIVLNIMSPYICGFNYSHQLIREIIPFGDGTPILLPFNFCLDHQNNILIVDFEANSVIIFSNKGLLLHMFGQGGVGRGEFVSPTAIALDSAGRIIIASENPDHCVQLF